MVSAGMCRAISYDSDASKMAQIKVWMAEKRQNYQTALQTGTQLVLTGIILQVEQICLQAARILQVGQVLVLSGSGCYWVT